MVNKEAFKVSKVEVLTSPRSFDSMYTFSTTMGGTGSDKMSLV